MRSPTTVALPLALAALALPLGAAGAADAASAGDTPMARFLVSFEGERTVRWSEPQWSPRYDCQHVFWRESNGSEVWRVKTPPQKALVWLTSYGDVRFQIGTWDPLEISEAFAFEGQAFIARERFERTGWDANDRCGPAVSGVNPLPADDCGNRLPRALVTASGRKGELEVGVTEVRDRNSPRPYANCQLIFPPDVPIGWPEEITGRYRVADLFNRRRARVAIGASRSWSHVTELMDGKGTRTETAGVRWTMTLERAPEARRPAAGRPARRRGRGRGRSRARGGGRAGGRTPAGGRGRR